MYVGVFGKVENLQWFINLCESIFLFDFLLTFFVDYVPKDAPGAKHEKSFKRIFFHYMYGDMFFELLPLIPLPMLELPMKQQSKFYIIKAMRCLKGLNQLNVPRFMKGVKEYFKKKLIELEKTDPKLADDSTTDNTKMKQIIFISLTLKTLKLVLVVFNFSFFIGMFWLLVCITIEEFKQQKHYLDIIGDTGFLEDPDYAFIDYYQLSLRSTWDQMVTAVYFAITSLATIGFGDYCPRSNLERCLGAIMLLFGVSIFSLCMGKFLEMLHQIKEFNSSLDNG
jgi:hypothetical protein